MHTIQDLTTLAGIVLINSEILITVGRVWPVSSDKWKAPLVKNCRIVPSLWLVPSILHQAFAIFQIDINTLLILYKAPRGLIYFKHIWAGGLIERGSLFTLAKMIVSVLHKELEYKVEKLKYEKAGGYAAEDQKQTQISSWWINHNESVHEKFYRYDWLIRHLSYIPLVLLVKYNKREMGGGLKREGKLINFVPLKRGGGGLIEDLW